MYVFPAIVVDALEPKNKLPDVFQAAALPVVKDEDAWKPIVAPSYP